MYLTIKKDGSEQQPERLIIAPSKHSSTDVLTKATQLRSATRPTAGVHVPGQEEKEYNYGQYGTLGLLWQLREPACPL